MNSLDHYNLTAALICGTPFNAANHFISSLCYIEDHDDPFMSESEISHFITLLRGMPKNRRTSIYNACIEINNSDYWADDCKEAMKIHTIGVCNKLLAFD